MCGERNLELADDSSAFFEPADIVEEDPDEEREGEQVHERKFKNLPCRPISVSHEGSRGAEERMDDVLVVHGAIVFKNPEGKVVVYRPSLQRDQMHCLDIKLGAGGALPSTFICAMVLFERVALVTSRNCVFVIDPWERKSLSRRVLIDVGQHAEIEVPPVVVGTDLVLVLRSSERGIFVRRYTVSFEKELPTFAEVRDEVAVPQVGGDEAIGRPLLVEASLYLVTPARATEILVHQDNMSVRWSQPLPRARASSEAHAEYASLNAQRVVEPVYWRKFRRVYFVVPTEVRSRDSDDTPVRYVIYWFPRIGERSERPHPVVGVHTKKAFIFPPPISVTRPRDESEEVLVLIHDKCAEIYESEMGTMRQKIDGEDFEYEQPAVVSGQDLFVRRRGDEGIYRFGRARVGFEMLRLQHVYSNEDQTAILSPIAAYGGLPVFLRSTTKGQVELVAAGWPEKAETIDEGGDLIEEGGMTL